MNTQSLVAACPSASSSRSASPNLLSSLLRTTRALVRALHHRRAARKIEELPDHLLADIGLTRDDVRHGLSQPIAVDPTCEFSRRARINTRLPTL